MEKQQVSTFLKILQIPSQAPPEEIKESLLASGWNESDADEAISVLYPDYATDGSAAEQSGDTSQIVAQRYVKQSSADETGEAAATTVSPAQAAAPAAATPEDATPIPEKAPIPDDLDTEDEKSRPHTDAPWLQQQADIYDVSEEEKQEMIRSVYRTNERLSPQTIHALLGIDVDLSEYEAAYEKRHRGKGGLLWSQILIIMLSSLAIGAIGLFLGLYYFEAGPFHPTITGDRG